MVENLRNKLILIAVVVLGSAGLLLFLPHPIRLGLDLAGGVRLVYRLDFEQAYKDGALDRNEPANKVIEETISIIRTRVDPDGVRNATLRRIGTDRIEIALPGSVEISGRGATGELAEAVEGTGTAPIKLKELSKDELENFPGTRGVVQIEQEKIRYRLRVGLELSELERGIANTPVAAHAAGAAVVLISDDQIKNAIENLGNLRFMIVASDGALSQFTPPTDLTKERQRVEEWHAKPENKDTPIEGYNSLPSDKGGPPGNLRWYPNKLPQGAPPSDPFTRLEPLLQMPTEWDFTGADLATVHKSQDQVGLPAVYFELRPSKTGPFTDFTEKYKGQRMAILLNNEVATAPTINETLPGRGIISGSFTDAEVDSLVTVLRSGSLQIRPILDQEERIGASVGQEYVAQGWVMSLSALGFVVAFMSWYFYALGIYASIGLIANMLMQLGVLSALQATLTLPGIAGIVLGIGMAVDANILIFERIREEQEKGQKPLQAAKAGFSNALSAIIDSNVTTVLAGAILYYIGTGPIRGFAVTLIIGVMTSMFAALVIVRVLIHMRLQRDPNRPFKLHRWLADANYDVVGKTKLAMGISAVLIFAGLCLFFWLPANEKYGIDFLGGATVKLRTEEPQTRAKLEELVKAVPGDIGGSAEVTALPTSETAPGEYTEFRVTFKLDPSKPAEERGEETFRSEIQRGLASVIQKGPIELTLKPQDTAQDVQATLYFEAQHPAPDLTARLESAGLKDPKLEQRPGRQNIVAVAATAPLGVGEFDLRSRIKASFAQVKDSSGKTFTLAEPIPETSVIGQQVVGELRDSAIKALLLSMLVTVIYIRVRFAEYSFGFAAVIALIHDILFTVGAVAFLIWIPWIHVQFDLALIAVFLTIVGYSINDTIVVFDRIRENLPRRKGTLKEIVNASINETFSRTIITSTSMATIFIVLIFNLGTGNVLEGFSFAMTFGIATGTFSSIYIAAPIYIWIENRSRAKDGAPKPPVPVKAAV
jgi:SecD/SecF fusion protein